MPKIKTATLQARNGAGDTLEIKSEISVSSHGEFRASVPANLAADPAFRACLAQAVRAHPGVRVEQLPKQLCLSSTTLAPLEPAMKLAVEKFIEAQVHTERVILYALRHQVSYALDADGRLVPNEALAGEGGTRPAFSAASTIMREDATSYMVAIWARVYDKTTYRVGDRAVVKYLEIPDAEGAEVVSPAHRLNAFETDATIPEVGNPAWRMPSGNKGRDDYTEIPYTDQAADYFCRMLLSMCELARRMDEFFGDKQKLQQAIARGVQPLLAA